MKRAVEIDDGDERTLSMHEILLNKHIKVVKREMYVHFTTIKQ
jgi:hypothetical protein